MAIRFFLLILITCVAYYPTRLAGFIWDDEGYIVGNPFLRTVEGLGPIWLQPGDTPQFYPMVFTTFWVEYHLWGLNPMGYHVVNVLLHGLNSGLLWLLLRRLSVPGAWLIAAIFAVHPVHVESVVWITERKNVLSGTFYLLAFLAYLRFSSWETSPPGLGGGSPGLGGRPPGLGVPRPGAWGWYGLALVLFVGALLSKTVTCSLPAVLILVWWWKRSLPTFREFCPLLPMFVLGAAMAMVTSWVEREYVGAQGPGFMLSPLERCLIAGRALCFYVEKLVWPHPLMFNYPRWHIDPADPWQYVYPAAVLAVGLILTAPLWPAIWPLAKLRQKLGRGPLTACLIFAGTLLPALGFFNVYPMKFYFVADHFQYLASIAMIALAVAGIIRLAEALGPWVRRFQLKELGMILAGCLLATFGYLTWEQCKIYRDPETLWFDTASKNPTAFLAQFNLGMKYFDRYFAEKDPNYIRKAVACFAEAEKSAPQFAELYVNWGFALAKRGDFEAAAGQQQLAQHSYAEAYRKLELALACDSQNPGREERIKYERPKLDGMVYFNMGLTLEQLGKKSDAGGCFEKALGKFKQVLATKSSAEARVEALKGAGDALLKLGRAREAVAYFEQIVAWMPHDPLAREFLERARKSIKNQ